MQPTSPATDMDHKRIDFIQQAGLDMTRHLDTWMQMWDWAAPEENIGSFMATAQTIVGLCYAQVLAKFRLDEHFSPVTDADQAGLFDIFRRSVEAEVRSIMEAHAHASHT